MSSSREKPPAAQSSVDAIAFGADAVRRGLSADGLDECEALDCEERKLRCELLREQIASTAQERELRALVLKRGVFRSDAVLVFGSAALLLLLLLNGPRPELLTAALALIALVLNSDRVKPPGLRRCNHR